MGDKRLKQIKLTEPGKLIIADVKEPQISKPDDVKIKVAYSAINMEDISFFKQDLNRLLWMPARLPWKTVFPKAPG